MKRQILTGAGILLIILASLLIFWSLRETDEKKIKATLSELCRIGSKSTGENPALGALKANRSEKVFAPRCHFDFRVNSFDGVYTPTEIGANILRFQSLFQWIQLEAGDLQIEVRQDEALLFFTGEFTGVPKNSQKEKISEIRDIEARLVRTPEGAWKFVRMKIRNVLEK